MNVVGHSVCGAVEGVRRTKRTSWWTIGEVISIGGENGQRCRVHPFVHLVHLNACVERIYVGLARIDFGGRCACRDSGYGNRSQSAQNDDHNQQLYQRKTLSVPHFFLLIKSPRFLIFHNLTIGTQRAALNKKNPQK
jgi:hypothetical protein